jgi:hypothetical protein
MKPDVEKAIEMHKQGSSMAEIGDTLGKSAAWVCKSFKSVGYKPKRDKYNKFAYTKEQADFVRLHWFNETADWIGTQIGKSGQSVRQWARKNIGKKREQKYLKPVNCGFCNSKFQPKMAGIKFCSYACMGAGKRKYFEQPCLNCGSKFLPVKPESKYCCHECSQEAYKKTHIAIRPYAYGGVNMRSTWEVKFAQWLDQNGLSWDYEPNFFRVLSGKRYAPDFYVPDHGAFYEIKGWMDERSTQKITAFRQEYPEYPLVVLGRPELKNYGVVV